MPAKVGQRYQMVIEESIRKKLGIAPGWVGVQAVVDGKLQVTFIPPTNNESLAGSLHQYSRGPVDDEDWHKIEEAAWIAHVDEIWGRDESNQ
jgi:hypothetical protein